MQEIKDIFYPARQVYAIDVEINGEGTYVCRAVELTKQKGSIHFTALGVIAIDGAAANFPVNMSSAPVCLILNGRGIIHRKITVAASLSDTDIIKQVIPNVNPEEFYIQKQEIAQQKETRTQIISLARKSLINKVMTDFFDTFHFIVDVSISPFALEDILPVIHGENVLHYKNIRIEVKENSVADFSVQAENETQTLVIENQAVDTVLLPALGIGLSYLIDPTTLHVPIEDVREKNEAYRYKQKTHVIGKTALIVAFIVLIVNFFIFDHYYKKTQDEQPQVAKQEALIDKATQLNETLSSKSKFLQQSGLLTPNKISFYADRIAGTVPEGITLTEWQFNPLSNPNKKESLTFQNSLLVISGISNQSTGFNQWIKELKNGEGIESVSILGYDHDIKEKNAVFTIELTVE